METATDMTKAPRLEHFGPQVLAGHLRSHRLSRDQADVFRDISAQWRTFAAVRGAIQPLEAKREYGVGLRMADGATTLDYFCGIPIASGDDVPFGFDTLELPALRYAVFPHLEHISRVRDTLELALATVLPRARLEPADDAAGAPEFIERYGEAFSWETGLGGLEVLIPVKLEP
jgi:AraC family transcriptional regulator